MKNCRDITEMQLTTTYQNHSDIIKYKICLSTIQHIPNYGNLLYRIPDYKWHFPSNLHSRLPKTKTKSNQVYLYLLFKRNIRNRRQRPHTVCRGTCNCCWPTKVLNEKHAVIEHFTVTRVYRVFNIIEDIPRFNFLFGVSIKCTYTGQPDLYNFRTNHTTTNNEYNESETHSERQPNRRPNKNKKWKNNENENQDTEHKTFKQAINQIKNEINTGSKTK